MLSSRMISRLVFHPRSGGLEPNYPVAVDGATLGCHARFVPGATRTLLYFHGNGELASESASLLQGWFASLGWNVVFVEYRGYGHSTGVATLPGMLGDGAAVVADLGVPTSSVVAFGRSLGSIYAVELAHRLPDLGGLILESGVANLMDLSPVTPLFGPFGRMIGRVAARLVPQLDQRVKLRGYRGPVLVLHTRDDRLVPVSHGERLYQWAATDQKRLMLFDHGGHNRILVENVSDYQSAVETFLASVSGSETSRKKTSSRSGS